ncbi:hydrogenase expression/formation protein HypE [Candidatus Binatus soli]|jgi:hydrogenase expression/formation protein HypE|uniref:hydrogenase expression/formation protein HypE n=1 Tax=Candidatus Binatus soli TaxID=1953413 RepID=UPI003D0F717F
MSALRIAPDAKVMLKHGAGGRAMRELIQQVFIGDAQPPADGGIGLAAMDDGAAIRAGGQWLVMTTDSYVIKPAFFPGGDIGRLAVSGTVNDLSMMGATDVAALTCAVIIEEGFPRADLERIAASISAACAEAGATIVTGDTKVMGRGEIDGIALNTAGVAFTRRVIPDCGLRPGDKLIVTGTIGDHGLAVMARRHSLDLQGDLRSDVAPLNGLIRRAIEAGGEQLIAMKDPTRGGLASTLHEMAHKSNVGIVLEASRVPISASVQAAGELLGIDPMHAANEGKAVIAVRPGAEDRVLAALRSHSYGRHAAVVAVCVAERPGFVILDTGFGRRLLAEPEGELLPRIC